MGNTMEYRGYYAKIEYSDSDNVFFGVVQGISDLIIFEGESVNALKQSFQEAIDDYLEMCKRRSYCGK